jgi:hypothetical protein
VATTQATPYPSSAMTAVAHGTPPHTPPHAAVPTRASPPPLVTLSSPPHGAAIPPAVPPARHPPPQRPPHPLPDPPVPQRIFTPSGNTSPLPPRIARNAASSARTTVSEVTLPAAAAALAEVIAISEKKRQAKEGSEDGSSDSSESEEEDVPLAAPSKELETQFPWSRPMANAPKARGAARGAGRRAA